MQTKNTGVNNERAFGFQASFEFQQAYHSFRAGIFSEPEGAGPVGDDELMSAAPAPPCRIVLDRRGVVLAVVSLLLSWWAGYADPVVNGDGVGELRAAGFFIAGQWQAGLDAAGSPFYALLVAAVGGVTGLPPIAGAHVLDAGFFVLLVLGFVALAAMLGGDRRVQGLAALVLLLHPGLNGLRSQVSGDAAYLACYVWSLTWFLHYICTRQRRSAVVAALSGLATLLFGLEAMVFLVVVPMWLLAREHAGGWRTIARTAIVAAGAGGLLGYLLWQQALQSGAPTGSLLLAPLDHLAVGWHEAGQALRFKLEALRGGFLDRFSGDYDNAALLAVIVTISVAGLVKALGWLYSGLALYAVAVSKRVLAAPARYWWGVFAVLAGGVLLGSACAGFSVTQRDAMTAALMLLAVVPAGLGRLWLNASRGGVWYWGVRWVMLLVIVVGMAGLDLRTTEQHLKEAGLWLRDNARPGDRLYSNSRIVVYYSGLDGNQEASRYTWRHAMNQVHRDQWREYEYLALVIPHADRHREGILKRQLDIEPVRVFSNDAGDRTLIFDTGD